MTIKKRLFCSNILMIVVPVAMVAFMGLLSMILLWVTLQSGGTMGLEDGEDFQHMGRDIAGQIQSAVSQSPDTWTDQMGSLKALTKSGALRIVVMQNGGPVFSAGEEQ